MNKAVFFIPVSILTHTSNAKCFMSKILIRKQGLAKIRIVVIGYEKRSLNHVIFKTNNLVIKIYFHFFKKKVFCFYKTQ